MAVNPEAKIPQKHEKEKNECQDAPRSAEPKSEMFCFVCLLIARTRPRDEKVHFFLFIFFFFVLGRAEECHEAPRQRARDSFFCSFLNRRTRGRGMNKTIY
jgi:hypothetical protein